MINLFIDTNIYLALYLFSNDDLEQLRKLLVAIRENEITLFVTDQVVGEYNRNREVKIRDSLKAMDEVKIGKAFPRIIQSYDEYELLKTDIRNFEEHITSLKSKLASDIDAKELEADKLVRDLFGIATHLNSTVPVVTAAKARMALGRPPGKDGSLGDAINWEILIGKINDSEDLVFATDDGDYLSKVNPDKIATYLRDEWQSKKNSEITLFRGLGKFFEARYPHIKLAAELQKEISIRRIISSGSFVTTHRYVAKLTDAEFTDQQARDLFDAALSNSQLYWLGEDTDVNTFFRDLIDAKRHLLTDDELERMGEAYPEPHEDIDLDDIPF